MASMISAYAQFKGSVWEKPAFKTLKTFLTDFFHCDPGHALCEDDLSVMSLLEEDTLCRYQEGELDFLLDGSKLDVSIDFVEPEEYGDVDTYTYTIICNDENAALDLKAVKDACGQDFIYFLDNPAGPYGDAARAQAYGAAVATDTTGLLKRYLKEEYQVEFAEARFRTFVKS